MPISGGGTRPWCCSAAVLAAGSHGRLLETIRARMNYDRWIGDGCAAWWLLCSDLASPVDTIDSDIHIAVSSMAVSRRTEGSESTITVRAAKCAQSLLTTTGHAHDFVVSEWGVAHGC